MKFKVIFLFLTFVLLSGCQTLKNLFGSSDKVATKTITEEQAPAPVSMLTKYSDVANLPPPNDRQYKKMTRERMEEEAQLHSSAGSMWVMEGQGAYLFAQNKTRREGDLLNVKLEGGARKQVVTKVNVIKKLLKQLEDAQEAQALKLRAPASEEEKSEDKDSASAATATDAKAQAKPTVAAAKAGEQALAKEAEEDIKEENFEVQEVPTKIVEKLADGNYRVKGDRPFMIGKREYKVIVTGLIRAEDYSDEGVTSNKILEPQFDVVSIKRTVK